MTRSGQEQRWRWLHHFSSSSAATQSKLLNELEEMGALNPANITSALLICAETTRARLNLESSECVRLGSASPLTISILILFILF